MKVIKWEERVVGPLALLLVRVTKQATRVGGLGKKITFLGDLPSEWDTSAVNLTNDLLLLSKCQSHPALSNKGSLIGSP